MTTVIPPPVVVKVDRHACGCAIEHWSDGRELKDPCPTCGMNDAGLAMQHAGAALCAVAHALARASARPSGGPSSPIKRS